MKVSVDLKKCEGHGRCYDFAPEQFGPGPDGKARVLVPEIGEDEYDLQTNAFAAQMMCPQGAITVEDE